MWSHLQITGTEEECGHTYKQQEYKECGHTYKQQEYKECGHTYKQQEYKECGHTYKQQEYKECGHTYKQQEYKECGHTYKQQEYKECGHTYKQQEYKECGHTYKQQEYKECGHTYKQQEYKECGHIYKQQLNRNRRSEWSHLHTITGIVEESDHTHNQPGVQGCDAGPVQNDDIASVDFTEHVMLSLADLISERKNLFLDKNRSSIFSFFLFCSGVGISVCWSQNQDTFPTSKAMLYTCSTKVASSSPEQWISKFSCSIRFSNWFLWKGKMTNKKIQSCC